MMGMIPTFKEEDLPKKDEIWAPMANSNEVVILESSMDYTSYKYIGDSLPSRLSTGYFLRCFIKKKEQPN